MSVLHRAQRIARLVAVVAGIAGIVLCLLVPLLPVKQTTATILWPQGSGADGNVGQITAPLVSGAPLALDVSIPCRTVASLPAAGGLVFSTVPPAGIDASRNGLFVRANADVVVVAFRDYGGRSGPAAGRQRGRLQRPARLGQRRRCRRRLRRNPRCRRKVGDREQTSGRWSVHRAEGARATGADRSCRRRHPIHHLADPAENRRDGAGRHLCGRGDRRAGGARSLLGSPTARLVAPTSAGQRRHVAGRRRGDRDAGVMASHRRDLLRRRLQPGHRAGVAPTPGISRTTTGTSARPRRRSTGIRAFSGSWRRSARQACGCGCPPRSPASAAG